MGKSPPRGISSSNSLKPLAEVCAALKSSASSPPLAPIIHALTPQAELHLVGGTVRDALMGKTPADFDLCTILPASEALSRLTAANIHALDVGMRHGTIIAVVAGHNVEITTFRALLPDGSVTSGDSIEKDLAGRDFTINAVAFKIVSDELFDPMGGVADLGAGLLRACGDPTQRLSEDPLRLLRMVRFGPCDGRTIDATTISAAIEKVGLIQTVSPERIRVELEKILLSPHPAAGLRTLQSLGALELLLPEVIPSIGVEQNEFHVEDVFDHTLTVLERCPADAVLRWAALFHDLGKPATLSIGEDGRRHFYGHEKVSTELGARAMQRLKFSNHDQDTISLLVREHMRPIDCGMPGTRRILRDLGDQYDRWRTFKVADSPPIMTDQEMQVRFERFDAQVQAERARPKGSVFDALAIDGNDLLALGMKPGKELGAILKVAHEAVLDSPELNEREKLLEFAKQRIKG